MSTKGSQLHASALPVDKPAKGRGNEQTKPKRSPGRRLDVSSRIVQQRNCRSPVATNATNRQSLAKATPRTTDFLRIGPGTRRSSDGTSLADRSESPRKELEGCRKQLLSTGVRDKSTIPASSARRVRSSESCSKLGSIEEVNQLEAITDTALEKSAQLLTELQALGLSGDDAEKVKKLKDELSENLPSAPSKDGTTVAGNTVEVPTAFLDLFVEMWEQIKKLKTDQLRTPLHAHSSAGSPVSSPRLIPRVSRMRSAPPCEGSEDSLISTTISNVSDLCSDRSSSAFTSTIASASGCLARRMDFEGHHSSGSLRYPSLSARPSMTQIPASRPQVVMPRPTVKVFRQASSPSPRIMPSSPSSKVLRSPALVENADHFMKRARSQVLRTTEIVRITDVYTTSP